MNLTLELTPEIPPEFCVQINTWVEQLEQLLIIAGQKLDVKEGIVSLTFTDNERIRELNRVYRGIDTPTDVLSFSLIEGEQPDKPSDESFADPKVPHLLGDIIISLPKAKAQAQAYEHSCERELGFLFVHGFLHILGYDHKTQKEEQKMFTLQNEVLKEAGLVR